MTAYRGETSFAGSVQARVIRGGTDAPLSWHIKNRAHPRFWFNWLAVQMAWAFSKVTGIVTLTGSLSAVHRKSDGTYVNYGNIAYGLVTTAFVNFMVDQLQAETTQWGDFKFHDSGVGTTAASNANTDIETTDGESRATGTQTEGASANIYRSVGTISYTTTLAITEHGLFSQSTGTTLLDRHVFSAINVINGDSIEFTYELTCTAES